jgi:hypothetical protein
MRVRVDAARQQQQAGGVDDLVRGLAGIPARISLMTAPSISRSAFTLASALTMVPF